METIDQFRGEYYFLSNFYPDAPFVDEEGREWKTSEHYFQAMKCENSEDMKIIQNARSAAEAKTFGRMVKCRKDWEAIKITVMANALKMKFGQNPKLIPRLLDTGDAFLVEVNTWHDNFWGRCICDRCKKKIGKNYLGLILIKLRDKFKICKENMNSYYF